MSEEYLRDEPSLVLRLGKTLQTIALIAHMKYSLKLSGAALVVCPLSVLSTWCAELKRWCPSLRFIKLHSSDPAERERLKALVLDGIGSYACAQCSRTVAFKGKGCRARGKSRLWRR